MWKTAGVFFPINPWWKMCIHSSKVIRFKVIWSHSKRYRFSHLEKPSTIPLRYLSLQGARTDKPIPFFLVGNLQVAEGEKFRRNMDHSQRPWSFRAMFLSKSFTKWWFQICFFSPRKLGKMNPFLLICFRWVGSTTNQVRFSKNLWWCAKFINFGREVWSFRSNKHPPRNFGATLRDFRSKFYADVGAESSTQSGFLLEDYERNKCNCLRIGQKNIIVVSGRFFRYCRFSMFWTILQYGTCYSNTKTWSRDWCQSLLKCWASRFT